LDCWSVSLFRAKSAIAYRHWKEGTKQKVNEEEKKNPFHSHYFHHSFLAVIDCPHKTLLNCLTFSPFLPFHHSPAPRSPKSAFSSSISPFDVRYPASGPFGSLSVLLCEMGMNELGARMEFYAHSFAFLHCWLLLFSPK
jgi:hypothetical protein